MQLAFALVAEPREQGNWTINAEGGAESVCGEEVGVE